MTKKRIWIAVTLVLFALTAAAFYARRWREPGNAASRNALLAMMPTEAGAIFYVDFTELRQSPFAATIHAWLPQSPVDPNYTQFQRDTGFDYERDLNRLAIAEIKSPETAFFAIADGQFDKRKIEAYASRSGTRTNFGGREIFSAPAGKISFTFLRNNRIALTTAGVASLLPGHPSAQDAKEWQTRFQRLAGSPLFAVVRQDPASSSVLAKQAPGGFQSPQLDALLAQLQWITIAGKPEGDRLRVVAEGECESEATVRQLQNVLDGILVLAGTGLNSPEMRKHLDPRARDAYLEILKAAEVSRIDRGETKSVRLVFDVTPNFLEAARSAVPAIPAASPVPSAVPATQAPPSVKAPPRPGHGRRK